MSRGELLFEFIQRMKEPDGITGALDLALKAAASVVQEKASTWHKEWRKGHKSDTHLEGKSDGADECVVAILALTSKGTPQ
jgi:hypothetical protein